MKSLVAIMSLLAAAHAYAQMAAAPILKPVEGFLSAQAGTLTLRYRCDGKGSPTVIVEQGGGISIERVFSWERPVGWAALFPNLAQRTRTCVYDRADLGRSSKTKGHRTAADTAHDLHALLERINERPPYVIAGQSLGGLIARMYAHAYPDEVAGLILIDTQHHDWYARLAEVLPPPNDEESALLRGYREGRIDPAILGERIDVRASLELLARAGGFGDTPLVVLTRSPNAKADGPLPAEWLRLSEPVHQTLQVELAGLSTKSRHIVAEKAGHNIQLEEPQLVLEAIYDVVAQVRARSGR